MSSTVTETIHQPTPMGVSRQGTSRAVSNTADEAAVDHSMRGPTLLFFGSAIVWLLVAGVLGLIESIKLHAPGFLSTYAFTTYGRVHPAAMDALLYGWLTSAGIGLGLWLTARLCRTQLRHGGLLMAAWALWNLGLTLGTLSVLGGDSTSFPWLEYPKYVSIILFTAYVFIAIWALLMFNFRARGHVYVSQWYVLAAFLWFPWVYATANLFLFFLPVQASAQAPINWWFIHNFYGLWLTPLALAAAYYLVPKIVGRPIHNYGLAVIGFWTWVFFTGWRGGQSLIDGPVPAWMVSVGIGAAILSIVPLWSIANNLFGTIRGHNDAVRWSPSLRFTYVGLASFVTSGILGILLANRTISRVLHFTQAEAGWWDLSLFGFLSMVFFGAIYYIVPRLTGWDWASNNLIRAHFWLSLAAIALVVGILLIAGLLQGYGLTDPNVPITATISTLVPLFLTRTCALLMLGLANLLFAASFLLNVMRAGGRPLIINRSAVPLDSEGENVLAGTTSPVLAAH